jgi:hypothetical protein
MDLQKKIQRESVDWINLAQDKVRWQTLVSMVMNEPSGSIKDIRIS